MLKLIEKLRGKSTPPSHFCSAVVPAAGSSRRMGGDNKLLAEIGGMSVIARTVMTLCRCACIDEIILAVREEDLLTMAELCKPFEGTKSIKLVVGGADRAESVRKALRECDERADFVAVHDGARPLVTPQLIEETVQKAFTCYAAAPAVPVKDTVKVVRDHIVESTPDRATLFAVQTPQVFDIALLRSALQAAADEQAVITDDCSAVERLGKEIYLTDGDYTNIKITTPEDLILAEAILRLREE